VAKFADVTTTYTSGAGVTPAVNLFNLKRVLKLAGWTIPASSDGSSYNSSGDQITLVGTGAGGMQNTGAWFRAQEPGGVREWCFQIGAASASAHARVKYSAASKFTGGSPGISRVPSATDEQVLIGSGTDASPTYGALFTTGTGTVHRVHVVANSTAIGGVYPFVLWNMTTGGATQASGMILQEPMAPGSYSSEADPCAVMAAQVTTIATVSAWFGYGTGSQVFSTAVTANVGVFSGSLGVDIASGNDVNGYPTYSATVSGSVRVKGVGSTIGVKGPARTWPATTNTTTDAKAYLGTWVYPFPDNTVPSVS